MGDLIQQAITQQDYSVTASVLAIGVFSLLTVAVSWLNSRYSRIRPVTHGTPVVIVKDGEPLVDTLRKLRVSLDDLMAAARAEGIERLREIRIAVLETNGTMSFFTGDQRSGAPQPPAAG
jgi:uncharacterized membrane protein YcaP (DUF421 family)